MLVLEAIYPAMLPHFTWGGTKCQSESICPRSQGMMARPSFYVVLLVLSASSSWYGHTLPSYPLSILNMTQGACQSHNTPVCSRGESIWGSHGKHHGIYFSAPLCRNQFHFRPPYIKLIFHPEERPQIFQNREKLPGLCHPGIQTEGGANQLPSMWYSHSVATCGWGLAIFY